MRTIFDGEQTCIQLDNHNNRHQRQHPHSRVAPKKPSQVAAREEPERQAAFCIVLVEPLVREQPPSGLTTDQVEPGRIQEERQSQAITTTARTTTTTTTTTAGGVRQQEMDESQQATKQIQQQHHAQRQEEEQPLGQQQVAAGSNFKVTRYLMGGHQQQQKPASQSPRSYPNNTLVEDLSRCHDNLWPKAARATSRTLKLIRACAPTGRVAASKGKQKEPSKPANSHTVGGDDEPPTARGQLGATPGENKRLATFVRAKRKECKFSIPDSILRLNSTLNQEDYNRALCVLTNDIRFQLHILLFGRLQTLWTLSSTILCILIPILVTVPTLETFVILGACAVWLGLQATGALVTSRCRKKLDKMLERSVAQANSYFLDHRLMLGVINRGGLLAKSRLVVPVVYFDTFECIEQIESIISADLKQPIDATDGKSDKDLRAGPQLDRRAQPAELGRAPPNGPGAAKPRAFAQSQLAKKIVLRYSQRWISHFDKRRLMFTDDKLKPRHLSTGKCLCQFIEEHLGRDKQIEDLDELRHTNQVEQSAPTIAEAPIEQLRVDRLEGAPRVRRRGNEFNDITRKQATIINIPTNNKNDFSELDERLLNETLMRPHARELFVPTLSQLVGMRDAQQQQQQQQTRANATTESSPDSSPGSNYSSKLIDGFASHLQQERVDSNSSPMTELSLELDGGESLLNRNDELIRRLKTLLEIRANEFSKGLEQANTNSTSNSNGHNPGHDSGNSPRPAWTRDRAPENGGAGLSGGSSLSGRTIHKNDASNTNNNNASPLGQMGKKFFNQTDGLFFLGAKKSHQPGVYARQQQQLLEIC